MTPVDRQLVYTATRILNDQLFQAWICKHGLHLGRRNAALRLRITQEQYRHRLHKAELILAQHHDDQETAP